MSSDAPFPTLVPPVEGAPCGEEARPGGAGLVSPAQARALDPGPRWYRLPEESWRMIRAEYLAGATAKQLAVKWGVSPTSVYRHACQEGFTKARRGEAVNLEAVSRFAADAAAAEARATVRAQAELAEREAREAEADPDIAAAVLLRRASAAALAGQGGRAQELVRLAGQIREAQDRMIPRACPDPAAIFPGALHQALARAFAWYDELMAACDDDGGARPTPFEAALLAAPGGGARPPQDVAQDVAQGAAAREAGEAAGPPPSVEEAGGSAAPATPAG